MTLLAAHRPYSLADYFEVEQSSTQKHEFHDGDIVAMAGGSPRHSLIISNFIREVGNRVKGTPCRVYDSNLRVRVPRSRFYFYPDATVVCGPTRHDPDDPQRLTVTNPKLIVEVSSPSTDRIDYGPKLRHYLESDTLEEYVLVAQDEPYAHLFFRQPDGAWVLTPIHELNGTARLRSLGIDLPLAEVYAGVEFPATDEPTGA